VYRLWRDLGYAIGALLAGVTADAFGLQTAMSLIATLTFASGVVAAVRMTETMRHPATGTDGMSLRGVSIGTKAMARPGHDDPIAQK
jgi:hypothetical protein